MKVILSMTVGILTAFFVIAFLTRELNFLKWNLYDRWQFLVIIIIFLLGGWLINGLNRLVSKASQKAT